MIEAHRPHVTRLDGQTVEMFPADMPLAPERGFASDNFAGAHPAVMEAVVAANTGHSAAYGADAWTGRVQARFRDLFGPAAEAFLVWNGTGANVTALASMVRPAEAVVCSEWAHIAVDEAGAPERIVGAKLITLPSADAKLAPEQIAELAHLLGDQHHVQPAVVSITQGTELGTLYTAAEVAAIADTAHRLGMYVHLDGARIANATAALGGTAAALRSFTVDAGVDVVSFGGTKVGGLGAEAVVYLNPQLAARAKHVRKMTTQLPSKMRFVAAQFEALLHDDLWIRLAANANEMAQRLYDAVYALPGVHLERAPQINSLYPYLPADVIEPLRGWSFFWNWDVVRHQVRWMAAWDTTPDDVARFAAGIRHAVG